MDARFEVNAADKFAADLLRDAAELDELVEVIVTKVAADLNGRVQVNASLPREGPPGPRTITGDYMGSWTVSSFSGADYTVAAVGTDRPQARRLEYGFVGVDSIGRHYDQPPYPHMSPAVDAIEPTWDAAFNAVHKKASGD